MTDHPHANGANPGGDLHDRLMDIYLADVVGGVEPPDLSQQVVAALESGTAGQAQPQAERRSKPRMAHNAHRRPPMTDRDRKSFTIAARDHSHGPPLARLITATAALVVVAAVMLVMLHGPAGNDLPVPVDNSHAGPDPDRDPLPGRDDAAVLAAFPDDWRDLLESAASFEVLDLAPASKPWVAPRVADLQTKHQVAITDAALRRAIVATLYSGVARFPATLKTDSFRDEQLKQKAVRDDLATSLYPTVADTLKRAGTVRKDFDLRNPVMRYFNLEKDPRYFAMEDAVADICRAQIAIGGFVEPDKWEAERTCTAFFQPPAWTRPADMLPAYRAWLSRELTDDDYQGFTGDQRATRFAEFKEMRDWSRKFLESFEKLLREELDKVGATRDITSLVNPEVMHGIRATAADGRAIELVCYNRAVFVKVGERQTRAGVAGHLQPALAHLLINSGLELPHYEKCRPVSRIEFSQSDPRQTLPVNDHCWLGTLSLAADGRAQASLHYLDGTGEIATRDLGTTISMEATLRVFAAIRSARLERQDLRDNNVPVRGVPSRTFRLLAPDGSVVKDLWVVAPAEAVYGLKNLEAALHAAVALLEPQATPDRADDSLQSFEFHSGGANHPEGYGEWQVVYRHADYSLGFSLWRGEKVLQYDTVKLPWGEARQLLQLIDAAGFPRRQSTNAEAVPGSIQMSFIRTSAAGPHKVSLWESEAVEADPIRALLQHLKKLIHTHTGREPVFRTEK